METQTKAKPFAKKVANSKYDPKKRYQFQLCESNTTAKPRDYETGELVDNPYPPIFLWTNEGQNINPESGEIENWRYLFGYHSIWVKEQLNPIPGKRQLENPKNFIEFKNGSLFVPGTNNALLDALMIQDEFEGCENPINIKPPVYRLVDLDKERRVLRSMADLAFESEKSVREMSFEDMVPMAAHFGIDTDKPEENAERIRTELIFRVKEHPDFFNKNFNNPKVKIKYTILKAMRENIISAAVIPGKMVLVGSNQPYFDLRSGDAAEQFANLVVARHEGAVSLYAHIESL